MTLARKTKKTYTYADYLTWSDDERWELIEGEAYNMTPAPLRYHQDIAGQIFLQLGNFLKDKPCRAYMAPFDVRLPEKSKNNEDIQTVVQPDIVVVCDEKKLDERGCLGAPDLVIEVVSPSTVSKDMKKKLSLYEKHHVKEYWIVHPEDGIVMLFSLGKGKIYGKPDIFSKEDTITTRLFPGLEIDAKIVFRR